jgi:hypothetical protein
MKNSNETIGSRTRDLPTYIVVPQPTSLPRAPTPDSIKYISIRDIIPSYSVLEYVYIYIQ